MGHEPGGQGRFKRLGISTEMPTFGLRQKPYNIPAEQALLGAILCNSKKAIEMVAGFLLPDHFYDPFHGRLYAECARLHSANQVANALTLRNWIQVDPDGRELGGMEHLTSLMTAMVGVLNSADYGRAIVDCWKRRETIDAANDLMELAYAGNQDIEAGLSELNKSVDRALAGEQTDAIMFDDAMDQAMAYVDEAMATSGMMGLDIGPEFSRCRRYIRFIADRLILLGGDTGMGKSALAWRWGINAAISLREQLDNGTPKAQVGGLLGITLEMDPKSIALRAACSWAGVPFDDAEAGRITTLQRAHLEDAKVYLTKLPILFVAVGGMTPNMIRMRARQAQRRFGGKVAGIIIDHLQLMDADGDAARAGGAWAMKSIINTLISFPKLFQCPVLALSQVTKEVRERKNKRPHPTDYAWGRALGEAADYALFVYREAYYLKRERPVLQVGHDACEFQKQLDEWQARLDACAHQAELIVAKARGGEERTIHMIFEGPTMRFGEDPGQ